MARSWTSGVMAGSKAGRGMMLGVLGSIATIAQAERLVVFSDDLEHGQMRSEWIGGRIEHAPGFSRYLGRMTDQPLGLKVAAPSENARRGGKVTYYMRFDLFTLDGWTGGSVPGKDMRFEVSVGERLMFSHSLSNTKGQGTYRDPTEGPAVMGYGVSPDCAYRGVLVAFELDAEQELNVQFRALGLESQKDYSSLTVALGGEVGELQKDMPAWGIDNVEIWCETENQEGGSAGREAELPLLSSSLAALEGGGANPLLTPGTTSPSRPPISSYTPPGPRELMPPGGGASKSDDSPIVMPPPAPAPESVEPAKREAPTDDPAEPVDPKDSDPTTDPSHVPSPGVMGLFAAAGLVISRRRR